MKDEIMKNHNKVLNFSNWHENYHSAYKYICKSDTQVCHSRQHPNLKDVGSPVTRKFTQALRAGHTKKSINKTNESVDGPSKPSCSKTKRLSNLDVAEFLKCNNIQRVVEFMAVAQEHIVESQKNLANLIYSKPGKSLQDLLDTTWKMHNASSAIAWKQTKRTDLIHGYLKREFYPGCVQICH